MRTSKKEKQNILTLYWNTYTFTKKVKIIQKTPFCSLVSIPCHDHELIIKTLKPSGLFFLLEEAPLGSVTLWEGKHCGSKGSLVRVHYSSKCDSTVFSLQGGSNAIYWASRHGHVDTLKFLNENKCPLDVKDKVRPCLLGGARGND